MTVLHLLIVAAVQGITEFLPVSSSGHLALIPVLTGFEDHGRTIDVAAHVGSLAAVLTYFRKEAGLLLRGALQLLSGTAGTPEARLTVRLAVATVPVALAGGALLVTGFADLLRDPIVIGWATILFGIVLYWADRKGGTGRTIDELSLKDAFSVGLWQAVSLVPGASRSGVSITGARLCGFGRKDSVRIAMLMSIPTIAAAGLISGIDAYAKEGIGALRESTVVIACSYISALVALHLMMRFLDRFRFTPYIIYRIILGAGLLLLI